MTRQAWRILVGWLGGSFALHAAAALNPDEAAFVERMAKHHGFDRSAVARVLEAAQHDEDIIARIARPAEAMPWHRYRQIFLTEERLTGGVEYWRTNEEILTEAEHRFGVPPHVVVAIIGIETKYGANTGKHRVADALKTLGFGYPKRAEFFRKEFEHFLLFAREEGLDPLGPLGSYAGAMGKSQFIPSSYRRYAVDFDGDGRRDLWHSDADAIGSVASYLAEHGWLQGDPVAAPARGKAGSAGALADAGGSKPSTRLGELVRRGVEFALPDNMDRKAVIVELEQEEGKEYWLGFNNFYVITRYNHSNLYAMAVHQLSEALLQRKTAEEGKIG